MFEIELFICIKMDLALNNLQWLICHKTARNIFTWTKCGKGILKTVKSLTWVWVVIVMVALHKPPRWETTTFTRWPRDTQRTRPKYLRETINHYQRNLCLKEIKFGLKLYLLYTILGSEARLVARYKIGDSSSNPGKGCLRFNLSYCPWEKLE